MEENKQKKEYWGEKFFGSKLNTVLLLVLIVLMIFAIYIMLQNKETYVEPLVGSSNEKASDISKIISANDIKEIKSAKKEEVGISQAELDRLFNEYYDPCPGEDAENYDEGCDIKLEVGLGSANIDGKIYSDIPLVVVYKKFADDSIAGYKFVHVLFYKEEIKAWDLSEANITFNCHAGRGHAYYGIEPCS